jgi:hypothetical protein
MVASRSDSANGKVDRFHCLRCDTVISFDQLSGTDVVHRHGDTRNK